MIIYTFICLNVTRRMRQPLIASTQNTIMSVVDTFGVRSGFYPVFLLSYACTQHMWGCHNSDTQLGCSCRFCCEGTVRHTGITRAVE